jgi:phage gp29-like protein
MSTPEKEATKAVDDADDAAANGGDDDNHEEAAEILTDLVQNQMSISSADTTQIAEAQATALQLLLQQGGASASKQQSMQALLDAARKGDIVAQQQLMGQVASNGEKKQHAFWDTQVSIS